VSRSQKISKDYRTVKEWRRLMETLLLNAVWDPGLASEHKKRAKKSNCRNPNKVFTSLVNSLVPQLIS
jgi:hypothetical protein